MAEAGRVMRAANSGEAPVSLSSLLSSQDVRLMAGYGTLMVDDRSFLRLLQPAALKKFLTFPKRDSPDAFRNAVIHAHLSVPLVGTVKHDAELAKRSAVYRVGPDGMFLYPFAGLKYPVGNERKILEKDELYWRKGSNTQQAYISEGAASKRHVRVRQSDGTVSEGQVPCKVIDPETMFRAIQNAVGNLELLYQQVVPLGVLTAGEAADAVAKASAVEDLQMLDIDQYLDELLDGTKTFQAKLNPFRSLAAMEVPLNPKLPALNITPASYLEGYAYESDALSIGGFLEFLVSFAANPVLDDNLASLKGWASRLASYAGNLALVLEGSLKETVAETGALLAAIAGGTTVADVTDLKKQLLPQITKMQSSGLLGGRKRTSGSRRRGRSGAAGRGGRGSRSRSRSGSGHRRRRH